jgi:glycosyltransferase involved in cell wall biosynthesis
VKTAIVCPNYPPSRKEGGISHFTQILARELVEMGEQLVIVTDDEYMGSGSDENPSMEVVAVPGPWNSLAARAIVDILSSRSVDLVNLQYSPSMYSASFKYAWGAAARRFPSVTSFHTLWGGGSINYLIALQLLSTSRAVLATNTEIVYLLEKYLPIFLKKTRRIPIGSNIRPSSRPRPNVEEEYKLQEGTSMLSYFGMCYPGKGMNILFEVARLLKERLDYQLLLIGGGMSDDEPYRRQAVAQVEAYGVEEHVLWTGRLASDDVSTLLSRSDVILLPYETGVSDRRGSLMAALAHGRAIVTAAPRIDGFPFRRWENMVWPERYSAGEFAELIVQVLGDEQLRKRLELGASRLGNEYQWPVIAEKTRDLFHEVSSGT